MEIIETQGSSVMPVRVNKEPLSIDIIEKELILMACKKDPILLNIFNSSMLKSNNTLIKEIINSIENTLKNANKDPEQRYTINLIFNSIKSSLQILDNLKLTNETNKNEMLCSLFYIVFLHFKRDFY